jgi:formylglycine-generating enzyme required for sulfatase activity
MKELPVLAVVGIILFLMVLSSIFRMREIRSSVTSARLRQTGVVSVPPPDPARFASLTIEPRGKDKAAMVYLRAGEVIRGTEDPIGEFDEQPVRIITLAPYWIDLKEVSNQHYQTFVKKTNRRQQEVMVFFDDVSHIFKPTLPAIGVSWFDAEAYCQWNGKRLPTEAEWEYAAHAGHYPGRWPWGDTFLQGYANVLGEEDGFAYTAPVGSFEAGRSDFGLYETAGNVAEWVSDWYDEFFYKEGQVTLPAGPETGSTKVIRGGSWGSTANDTRTTKRNAVAPYRTEATIGFRCAISSSPE